MTKHWYWVSYNTRRSGAVLVKGCVMWFEVPITEDEHVGQLIEILAGKENAQVALIAFSPMRVETTPDAAPATGGH
jgi:hypothetical protein